MPYRPYQPGDFFGDSVPNEDDFVKYKNELNNKFYQMEDPKQLIAYHNLSEENFVKALELGEIPVSSIAVTSKDILYEDFGSVSRIMKPSVVDPATTPVYTRDAWTGTFPSV